MEGWRNKNNHNQKIRRANAGDPHDDKRHRPDEIHNQKRVYYQDPKNKNRQTQAVKGLQTEKKQKMVVLFARFKHQVKSREESFIKRGSRT